jgi:glycine dehydrogenase subunit 1
MLAEIGVSSVDELFRDVPDSARNPVIDGLPNHQPESAVERHLAKLAAENTAAGSVPFFLGAGAYRHHVPASVDALIQRGEFLTSYTPYQPEVAQGTLQYLFEFQTQVALLTGMEVANASMYDGSTACAEAVAMANRVTRRGKAILSGGLHPHYREVTQTQARWTGYEATCLNPYLSSHDLIAGSSLSAGLGPVVKPRGDMDSLILSIDDKTSCVVVQYPDFFGNIRDLTPLAEACHAHGALLIVVVTEIVSLGLLTPPGDMGADIVVAEGQSLGNSLNFGGPYVGLFATRETYLRQMPGRLCGQTVDADGRRGFVLTLSTREQHIRREKATSNICTNSGLCALAFTIHLSLLGEDGFLKLARLNHESACLTAGALAQVPGVAVLNEGFFNEFTIRLRCPAAPLVERLARQGVLAGVPVSRLYPDDPELANLLLVASTELTTDEDRERLVSALKQALA